MKLTYDELKELLENVAKEVTTHPWIRSGQALFNILVSTHPEFEYIRGSKQDPFYVDYRILECIKEIASQEAIDQWIEQDLKIKLKKNE